MNLSLSLLPLSHSILVTPTLVLLLQSQPSKQGFVGE